MAAAPIEAAKYGVQPIAAGTSWLRVHRVIIDNQYMGLPTIAFDEEQISEVGAGPTRTATPTRVLTTPVDLAATIPMFDPVTGNSLGTTMTHGQVYAALYSLYRSLA